MSADNYVARLPQLFTSPKLKHNASRGYLQGEGQAYEVHHHLFVSQLHAEDAQQSEEGLVVLPPAALLLAAQVDVSVQLLAVLSAG